MFYLVWKKRYLMVKIDELLKQAHSFFTAKQYEKSFDRFSSGSRTCFNCGGQYPHEDECPAKHRRCYKCESYGHYSKFLSENFREQNNMISGTRSLENKQIKFLSATSQVIVIVVLIIHWQYENVRRKFLQLTFNWLW